MAEERKESNLGMVGLCHVATPGYQMGKEGINVPLKGGTFTKHLYLKHTL